VTSELSVVATARSASSGVPLALNVAAIRELRTRLAGLEAAEAAALLRERIEGSPSNENLLSSL